MVNLMKETGDSVLHKVSLFFTYACQFLVRNLTGNVLLPRGNLFDPAIFIASRIRSNALNLRVRGFLSNSITDQNGIPQQRNSTTTFIDLC